MSTQLTELVLSTKDNFTARLSDTSLNFEAEAGFAIQSLSTEYAMKLALANRQSVIDAVTNVAAIGISLNPAKKQAYLVPRDGKICLDISYMGLIDLAVASGAIKWAQAAVVYANDSFELNGYDAPPAHKFSPFSTNRGLPVGAYVVVKTADNEYLTHPMSIAEIYAIRDRASQSFKGGKSSPWKSDEGEMIKKTVVKQAYKYWPKTNDRLQNAIHYLNTETGEGLPKINNVPTRKALPSGSVEIDYEEQKRLIKLLELSANNGTSQFLASWKTLDEKERELVTRAEADRIKSIAIAIDAKVVKDAEND
jgi:recombination protein RecT